MAMIVTSLTFTLLTASTAPAAPVPNPCVVEAPQELVAPGTLGEVEQIPSRPILPENEKPVKPVISIAIDPHGE